MKKLLILLLLPLFSFSQEDIERYKVYDTENIYTSLLLDSATGQTWQLQIGIGDDSSRMKTVLSDDKFASTVEEITEDWEEDMEYWEENYNSKPDSIVSAKTKANSMPASLETKLLVWEIAQNGRFKLYPTGNLYNFIMVDVIDGRTWQVQWNIDYDKRLCIRIY